MVADQELDIRELVRWGGLIALSLFAHLFLLDMISLKPIQYEEPLPQKIRITLSALAAPKIEPQPLPAPKAEPEPQKQSEVVPAAPAPKAPIAFEQTQSSTIDIVPAAQVEPKAKADPEPALLEEAVTPPKPKLPVPTPRLITRKPKLTAQQQLIAKAVQKIAPAPPKSEPKEIKETVEQDTQKPASDIVAKATSAPATKSLANNTGESNATVIHEANYRRRTAPSYPRRAYELGQQGIVTLAALVNPSGKTGQLKIEQSSGHRLLDRAALAAVKKWEFEPLIQGGKKVSSWVRVPVKFIIN